jgi:hypothetical protein
VYAVDHVRSPAQREELVGMSRKIFVLSILSAFAILPGMGLSHAADSNDPAVVKKQFDEVISRLDQGGDLLVVANLDGALEELMSGVLGMVEVMPAVDPSAKETKATVKRLAAFLDANGFYAVNGWGMSVVPCGGGLNNVKTFISRDASAAGLPLWRAMVGVKPVRLAGLDYFPKDAVFASASAGDLNALWLMVRRGVKEVLPAEAQAAFDKFLKSSEMNLGISIDKLMASQGRESFCSLQLSETVMLPTPALDAEGKPLTLPSPSLLIGLSVKDGSLLAMLEKQFTNAGLTPQKVQVGDAVLQTVVVPLPLPLPLQPTFVQHKGMLLFGSQQQVVRDALAAFEGKSGLASTDVFKKEFEGLPLVNNGLSYVSPRFSQAMIDFQSFGLSMSGQSDPAASQVMRSFMNEQSLQRSAMVRLNWKSGIVTKGRTSSGGKEIVMSMAVAPVGLMAAIAIPSFVKARAQSMNNACINNLRMLDSAKEQWALESGKSAGPVDPEGAAAYIKGGLPTCPQGGAYVIGPLGASPTCTEPGHALR